MDTHYRMALRSFRKHFVTLIKRHTRYFTVKYKKGVSCLKDCVIEMLPVIGIDNPTSRETFFMAALLYPTDVRKNIECFLPQDLT